MAQTYVCPVCSHLFITAFRKDVRLCPTCTFKQEPSEVSNVKKEEIKPEIAETKPETYEEKQKPGEIAQKNDKIDPNLPPFSLPSDYFRSEVVYKRITKQAKADLSLRNLLSDKQNEYKQLSSQFEDHRRRLKQAKMEESAFRKALFRLQERLLSDFERLKEELIDQLRSLHVYGFEGIKTLKQSANIADPPFSQLEKYRKSQEKTADMLLATDKYAKRLGNQYDFIPKKRSKPSVSLSSLLLDPSSPSFVYSLLSKSVEKVRKLQIDRPGNSLTVPVLSAIVKGVVDGTLANELCGGNSDPRRVSELLSQIRHSSE